MKRNDLSRALVAFDQDSTIVAVVELSLKTWLVAGSGPGGLAPAAQEPACRCGAAAGAAASLARRGGEGRPPDRPDRGGLRGRPRRVLAGAGAALARHRSL